MSVDRTPSPPELLNRQELAAWRGMLRTYTLLQRELEALHATRTLRLLRVPRQVYAQVRRVRTDRTS